MNSEKAGLVLMTISREIVSTLHGKNQPDSTAGLLQIPYRFGQRNASETLAKETFFSMDYRSVGCIL